ncbi:MAG: phosphotransferase [Novosphingobium sp.]
MSIAPAALIGSRAMPRPQDMDAHWLNDVLGTDAVASVRADPVGAGQIGDTVRLTLHYRPGAEGPATLIGKFASLDPASRDVARSWSLYEREVRFYHELAPRARIRTPRYHGARMDGDGAFVLLLEDLAPAAPGDQFRGLEPAEMKQAVAQAARLHAAFWDADADPGLGWLDAGMIAQPFYEPHVFRSVWPAFRDRYADRLDSRHLEVCDALAEGYEGFNAPLASPRCVTHNDYRPDNMLLGDDHLTVVDWQSAALGWNAVDIAYLIGGAYSPDDRKGVEEDLLALYHDELLRQGVEGYGLAQLRADYRHFTFAGINVAVGAAMLVKRTERGDRLFLTMLDRFVSHVIDQDALGILRQSAGV